MMLKRFIKKQLANTLAGLKICHLKTKLKGHKRFVVLMYHRVFLPMQTDSFIEPGMFVTPDTFELHLRFLARHFTVVRLDDVFKYKSQRAGKPICALTFDDAWEDFYINAYPLLKKYKMPATLFVPTHFIGTDQWFWTDRLAQILYQVNSKNRSFKQNTTMTDILEKITSCNGPIDRIIQNAIRLLKMQKEAVIEDTLDVLARGYGVLPAIQGSAFIDWGQLTELAASEYVTIGSHTDRHLILTNCNDQEILMELQRSMQKLRRHGLINPDFIPFCYPNGNFNSKISQMVADSGYDMAVTTQNGWNQFTAEPFTLRRIGLHDDISCSPALLGCRLAGIF